MTGGLAEAGGLARANQAYAVNGQRPESNGYLLDGVSNSDNVNGGFAIRVPVDAIAEFRILTLNAPAEYGGTSGATTSVVTKSGSNSIHGDAYEFVRNDIFNATTFPQSSVPPYKKNDFGYTIGGPVYIPKVYNTSKEKTFFFFSEEFRRVITYASLSASVPSAAERSKGAVH